VVGAGGCRWRGRVERCGRGVLYRDQPEEEEVGLEGGLAL